LVGQQPHSQTVTAEQIAHGQRFDARPVPPSETTL
jgi:hypothetical protein